MSTEQYYSLQLSGWIMDGMVQYGLNQVGDIVRVPLLVVYADRFQTVSGIGLSLPAEPVLVLLTTEVAAQKNQWALGERIAVIGTVRALSITRGREAEDLRELRQAVASMDLNRMRNFRDGSLHRDAQLKRVAHLRSEYRRGLIALETFQVKENQIFARDQPAWHHQLDRLHEEQLDSRKYRIANILARSKQTAVLANGRNVYREVADNRMIETRVSGTNELSSLRWESVMPKIRKPEARKLDVRLTMVKRLHRYRERWLKAGRPANMLPEVSSTLAGSQGAWLAYEAGRDRHVSKGH